MEKMGNPNQSIFIGDGGHDELVGAKKVGMKTIKVDWFKKRDLSDCIDSVVNEKQDLIDVIKRF